MKIYWKTFKIFVDKVSNLRGSCTENFRQFPHNFPLRSLEFSFTKFRKQTFLFAGTGPSWNLIKLQNHWTSHFSWIALKYMKVQTIFRSEKFLQSNQQIDWIRTRRKERIFRWTLSKQKGGKKGKIKSNSEFPHRENPRSWNRF